jgi:hypothetical protein
MFKFFDLEGFADGFQMYDLLAKPFRPYSYIYPFIELGLGLGYLSRWQPMLIYTITILVMLFGALGVVNALRKGLDVECACMGSVLSVPLSTVALVEDLGMAAMALAMLVVASYALANSFVRLAANSAIRVLCRYRFLVRPYALFSRSFSMNVAVLPSVHRAYVAQDSSQNQSFEKESQGTFL